MKNFNLQRFTDAQKGVYLVALAEIGNGRKVGHWIWYIFPQLVGMGYSYNSQYYGIENLDEAVAYLGNEELASHLREITEKLLFLENLTAIQILGHTDAMKVRSCMTLFDVASPHDIFEKVLIKYYDGKRCNYTVNKITNN
jgi:uncharacterized protein (DUF1810 family)